MVCGRRVRINRKTQGLKSSYFQCVAHSFVICLKTKGFGAHFAVVAVNVGNAGCAMEIWRGRARMAGRGAARLDLVQAEH
jgi:hypothetical protein